MEPSFSYLHENEFWPYTWQLRGIHAFRRDNQINGDDENVAYEYE
jgi:hypothetical protein